MTFDFYFYGSEYEAFIKTIKVLNHIFGDNTYKSFLVMSVFLGLLTVTVAVLQGRKQIEFFKHLIGILLIGNLFLARSVDINVYPFVGENLVVPESGVSYSSYKLPFGIALPLWLSNAISNGLVKMIDKGFGCPIPGEGGGGGTSLIGTDLLCYTHYGAGGAMGLVSALQDIQHYLQGVDANFRVYVSNCWFPALDLGVVSRDKMGQAPDILQYLYENSLMNWHTPYRAIPELHGGSTDYPASSQPHCDCSAGVTCNCPCKEAFALIKQDLELLKDQFVASLVNNRAIGAFFGSTTASEIFMETLLTGLYSQICTDSNCPTAVERITGHLYAIRAIDYYIAEGMNSSIEMMKISEIYRSTTAGWRGHGFFMFYFLPKIRTVLFALVPFLFLLIYPFLLVGYGAPFYALIPNLIWLTMWDPILAVLNDMYASEFADQLLKTIQISAGGALVGITNSNLTDVFTIANEKLALYGYMAGMSLMLTGFVANAIAVAWVKRSTGAFYATERGLQPIGKEVGRIETREGAIRASEAAAQHEAESRSAFGMPLEKRPTSWEDVEPKTSQWDGTLPSSIRANAFVGRAMGGIVGGMTEGRKAELIREKGALPDVTEDIAESITFRLFSGVAQNLNLARVFFPEEYGELRSSLEAASLLEKKQKAHAQAAFLAEFFARHPGVWKKLMAENPMLAQRFSDIANLDPAEDPDVFKRAFLRFVDLDEIRGFGNYAELVGALKGIKEAQPYVGYLSMAEMAKEAGIVKSWDEFHQLFAKGQFHTVLPQLLKQKIIGHKQATQMFATELERQKAGFFTEVANFLTQTRPEKFKSLDEALAWFRSASPEEQGKVLAEMAESGAFARAMEKSQLAAAIAMGIQALGKDRVADILREKGLMPLFNEAAKAYAMRLPQAVTDKGIDPSFGEKITNFIKAFAPIYGGEEAAAARLAHHLAMVMPLASEEQKRKALAELKALGVPEDVARNLVAHAREATLHFAPVKKEDGTWTVALTRGEFRGGEHGTVTISRPRAVNLGKLGAALLTSGTLATGGTTQQLFDATAKIDNLTLQGLRAAWDTRTGKISSFSGALFAKNAEEVVDFARKAFGVDLKKDTNAMDRLKQALEEGRPVALRYEDGKLYLGQGETVEAKNEYLVRELDSTVVGRESIFKDFDQGEVSDFYVRMDLDRDGKKELYRLDGRYTLDRGIMKFEGDVYRVGADGTEVKINPRGGITKIEGLQVAGITHGKAEAEDAFNVPTVKLSMFSVGADGRMSPEGVREILKTFSMATDESLDPETRKAAMARGEFYLHLLENDAALRAGFVKSMTDLVHTYIRETHDVGVANKIAAGVQGELKQDSKDHIVGKFIGWFSGWSGSIRAWARDDFSKTAKESTTVQKFAGAVEGILTEANQVLSDEQQMKVLGNIYETAVGRAIHTVREKVGEYETDRSPVRAFTGSLPGPDVGRTGERLLHDYFDNPYTTEDVENFAKHKFATSGLVKPEDVFPELKDEKGEKK